MSGQRTAWCPECRSRQVIEDQHMEGHMTPAGEVGYGVTDLACGHVIQGPEAVVTAAPGAPYAGPGRAVAASHRPRDLAKADQRQRELEHDSWTDA